MIFRTKNRDFGFVDVVTNSKEFYVDNVLKPEIKVLFYPKGLTVFRQWPRIWEKIYSILIVDQICAELVPAGISANLMNVSDLNIHPSSMSYNVNVSSIRMGYPVLWTPTVDENNLFGGVVISFEGQLTPL